MTKTKSRIEKLNILTAGLLFIIFFAPTNFVVAQIPKRIAVRAARMLDVKSGNIVNNAVVLIEGGRIVESGTGISIPAGTETIDLGDATLMPGLIDAHTHLLQNYNSQ